MTSIATFRTPSPVDDVLYKGRVFVKGKATSESIVDAVVSETSGSSPPKSGQMLAGILAAGVAEKMEEVLGDSPLKSEIKDEMNDLLPENKEVENVNLIETCDCKRDGYKPVCFEYLLNINSCMILLFLTGI